MLGSRFWKIYAYFYDILSALLPYRQMLDDVVEAMDMHAPVDILDVGCGTGNFEARIAQTTKLPHHVLGIDSSESMLARAVAKCRGSERIQVRLMDVESGVELEDMVFDRIISTNVLYTLDDPMKTLSMLVDHLKDRGIMVHTTPMKGFSPMAIFLGHCKCCRTAADIATTVAALPSLIAVGMLNILIVKDGASRQCFWTQDELQDMFESCGLSVISNRPTYAGQDWLVVACKGGEKA